MRRASRGSGRARYKRIAIVAGIAALVFAVFAVTITVLLQRARDAETQATLAKVKAAHDRDRAVRKEAEAKVAADEAESRRAQEKAEKGRAERASFEAKVPGTCCDARIVTRQT